MWTIAKTGVVLSVILFCMAVGYYALTQLTLAEKSKEVNLYALVPEESCIAVLESDNINYYQDEFPQLNYTGEFRKFRLPGLFNYLLGGLTEYTTHAAHGLSSHMNRVMISFHVPGTLSDQVVYFRMGEGDETALLEMLQSRTSKGFEPKKEKHRGKVITVYPLESGEFLAVYKEAGVFVASYQKRLIEQVIEAQEEEGSALADHPVFTRITSRKKAHNYFTLYGRSASLPLLQTEDCWSEYDFHMNSDVIYLSGDMFTVDTCRVETMVERLEAIPEVCADSLVIASGGPLLAACMDSILAKDSHTIFEECVVNLSREAAFTVVADMDKVACEPERFTPYLSPFLVVNAALFRSFIISGQISVVNDRFSHIIVLTYKK